MGDIDQYHSSYFLYDVVIQQIDCLSSEVDQG